MFNLFKESRLDANGSNLTYRELMALLPRLDGSTISKKELVMLKYLSFAHIPSVNSLGIVTTDEMVREDAGTDNFHDQDQTATIDEELVPHEEQAIQQEFEDKPRTGAVGQAKKSAVHRRRITRKAPRTTATISDLNSIDGEEGKKLPAKVKIRKQKLRPVQIGATLSLEEVVKSIRPCAADFQMFHDDVIRWDEDAISPQSCKTHQ